MKTFTTFEYLLIALGTLLNDSDKESWEVRLNQGTEALLSGIYADKKALVAKVQEIYGDDKAAKYALLSAAQALENVMSGYSTQTPVAVDEASSGLQIQSLLTRDIKGIISTGMFNGLGLNLKYKEHLDRITANLPAVFKEQLVVNKGGNFYKLLGEELERRTGIKFSRKVIKACTVPYFYAGISAAKKYLGDKETIQAFEESYAFLAEGGSIMRNTFKELWNSSVTHYRWDMPDGYQVAVPVVKRDNAPQTYEVYVDGIKISGKFTLPSNEPIKKGSAHTLGLGAHFIHSMDSYVLRELNRRCNHKGYNWLCKVSSYLTQEGKEPTDERILRAIQDWRDCNMISVRVLEWIEEPTKLPEQMQVELLEEMKFMPDNPFEILNVHDEFMTLPCNVNVLRMTVNRIFASIYKGNFLECMHLGIKPAPFDPMVYQMILDSDYTLS